MSIFIYDEPNIYLIWHIPVGRIVVNTGSMDMRNWPSFKWQMELVVAQYQKITKVSNAAATRHLSDLLNRGYLIVSGGGRNTRYKISPIKLEITQ